MHSFLYLFEKKGDPFHFLPSFYWTACQNLYMINRYWDISRDWERLQRTTTLHGRLGGLISV